MRGKSLLRVCVSTHNPGDTIVDRMPVHGDGLALQISEAARSGGSGAYDALYPGHHAHLFDKVLAKHRPFVDMATHRFVLAACSAPDETERCPILDDDRRADPQRGNANCRGGTSAQPVGPALRQQQRKADHRRQRHHPGHRAQPEHREIGQRLANTLRRA